MIDPQIISLLTLFLYLFVIVLIAYAITLTDEDKSKILDDAGWFTISFAFVIVITSIPDIHRDQYAIVSIIMLFILILTIIIVGLIEKNKP